MERGGEVYIVSTVDGSERLVTRNADGRGGLAWSPDGTVLAFAQDVQEDCGTKSVDRLELINSDGTAERRLFPSVCSADDFDPDWQPRCTHYGTDGSDVLIGTPGNDVICALRGDDRIASFAGDDVIIGGDGNDTIFGGLGKDDLFGSAGKDKLFAKDGEAEEVTNGGPGHDVAIVDGPSDRPWEVERIVR
jgi:hemolysin type calcium-binding protein